MRRTRAYYRQSGRMYCGIRKSDVDGKLEVKAQLK